MRPINQGKGEEAGKKAYRAGKAGNNDATWTLG